MSEPVYVEITQEAVFVNRTPPPTKQDLEWWRKHDEDHPPRGSSRHFRLVMVGGSAELVEVEP